MNEIPTLETSRLRIRPFRRNDAEALHAMHGDEEVMRFSGGIERFPDVPSTIDYMATHLGYWQLFGFGKWAVEEKASGILVGRVGFFPSSALPGEGVVPELGWLLNRPFWGQGFATEAGRAALHFASQALGQHRIVSFIEEENRRSVAVAERLGQRADGTIEHYGFRAVVYSVPVPLGSS